MIKIFENNTNNYNKKIIRMLIVAFIVNYLIEAYIIFEYDANILPETYWQIISFTGFFSSIFIGLKLTQKSFYIYLIAYQIFYSILLQEYYLLTYHSIIYPEANDALIYISKAFEMRNASIFDTINDVRRFYSDISDLGAFIFMKVVFSFTDSLVSSMRILAIMNSLIQVFITIMICKISNIVFYDSSITKWVAILWGTNFASIFFNVSGLKEPVFCLICTASILYIYKLKIRHSILNVIILAICIISTIFFRYYITIFLLLIFLGYNIFNRYFTKYFSLLCILGIIIIFGASSVLAQIMPELIYAITKSENSAIGGFTRIVYYGLAFYGPIPKFFDSDETLTIITNQYSIVKFSFSIFAILGSILCIKQKKYNAYPLIVASLMIILLLIFSSFFIDMRFAYVFMPMFFILIVFGTKFVNDKIYYLSLSLLSIIIYMFNLGLY